MSAALIREAASLVRARAEAATPGPWTCYGDHLVWPSDKGPAANDPIFASIGPDHDDCAEHIAGMDPTVALAVADWLDYEAEGVEFFASLDPPVDADEAPGIAVARAYLGRSS